MDCVLLVGCLCELCAVCVDCVLFVCCLCAVCVDCVLFVDCLCGLCAVCMDSTLPDPRTALGSPHELLWPDTAVLLHH